MTNLYKNNFESLKTGEESFETLLKHKNITIQKILSKDLQQGEWYEQNDDEWVVLLEGNAILEYETQGQKLEAGEALFIPKGLRHRVKETSDNALWLAVHIA